MCVDTDKEGGGRRRHALTAPTANRPYNKRLDVQEKTATLASLRRRAQKLTAGLARLEGVSVQPSDGAMYSFPRVGVG